MWILTGPFDVEIKDEIVASQKSKLLKTGKIYGLGRKDQPLIINSARISHHHCDFQVGNFGEDDAALEPSLGPTLQYVDKKEKKIKIERGGKVTHIEPLGKGNLEDGDTVWVTKHLKIIVKWERLCCYYPSVQSRPTSLIHGCTSLGMIFQTPNKDITHHLIASFTANAAIASSLLSASQFVKAEWLEEVIRLGREAEDGLSDLERTFTLPPLSKYRPSFSPTLQDSQKIFKIWEPNEERVYMLKDYRFYLAVENIKAMGSDMIDLIKRGEGAYEFFDIRAGKSKWHQAFTRGIAKKQKTVFVGERESLQTVLDGEGWQDLLDEIELFHLPFVSPNSLIQAVINVDTSALDNSSSSGTAQASHSDQPKDSAAASIENETTDERSRRLPRRVTIRESSIELTALSQGDDPIQENKRPPRRVTRRTNSVIDALSAAQSEPKAIDLTEQIPNRPAGLKRRRQASSEPVEGTTPLDRSVESERVTKKAKKLFDMGQTQDFDMRVYTQLDVPIDADAFLQVESQTRSPTDLVQSLSHQRLAAVIEEEEETQTEARAPDSCRGIKRKAEVSSDTEMIETSKKQKFVSIPDTIERAVDIVASADKPDIDSAFLKAVASTKKGKKKEDFDRDFNNLKIARPEVENQEEQWDAVDDFGVDTGIRGNFMIIVELDVERPVKYCRTPLVPNWQGKPNFKKFRKALSKSATLRTKVDLVISEDRDYGLGPSYWKGGSSQLQENQKVPSSLKGETQTRVGRGRSHGLLKEESEKESDEYGVPVLKVKSRTHKQKGEEMLFLESEDEVSTLRSSPGSQRTRKKATMIVEDESDDGATFKGFRGTKGRR